MGNWLRRISHRPWRWGLVTLGLVVLLGLWPRANPALEPQMIRLWSRSDGAPIAYYAVGDEFLTAAFQLLDDYWIDLRDHSPNLLRGHLDHYLPPELQALHYEPADDLMADFADRFFAARHPQTGLIPYAYDVPIPGDPHNPAEAHLTSDHKQPVGLIARAVEFCRWFPQDQTLQQNCVDLAHRTMAYFDVPADPQPNGLWGWVDVGDTQARSSLTLTQDYGDVALAMAQISQWTGDSTYAQWADEKVRFVWQQRMTPDLPLLQEQFVLDRALERPDEPSSDTDTLYFVRQLFDLAERTGQTTYRDWALAVTDLWVEQAWNESWGHFVRKLSPDGTPAVDTLYGDGKYNTLAILEQAYVATGKTAYLERLRRAWKNLAAMGQGGLAPEAIQRGQGNPAEELDAQQTFFLEILVDTYNASGDPRFLADAEALGHAILQRGESVMRLESGQAGQAFLKLALARQPVERVSLSLAQPNTPIPITQAGKTVGQLVPPTEEVVIYLAGDGYGLGDHL
ncbi:MAG: hypothetical protein ACHWZW_13520 [Spirulina sp.]